MIAQAEALQVELHPEARTVQLAFGTMEGIGITLPRSLAPQPGVIARGRIKTPDGPAERIEVLTPGPRSTSRLVLEVEASGEGVVLALEDPSEPGAAEPIEILGLGVPERIDPDGAWIVVPGEAQWLLIGLLSGAEGALAHAGERWLAPAGVRLWLRTGPSPEAVLEAWANRVGAERGARLVPRGGVGWPGGGASESLALSAAELPDPIGEAPAPGAAGRQAVRRVRDLAAHAHESARLWHLTPPAVGSDLSDLPRLEAELSLASLGGFAALASPPDRWPPEAWARARRALPPLARTIRPLAGGGLVAPLRHGRLAVWIGNPREESAELGLDPTALGSLGTGPFHVYDFWPDRVLGRIESEVPAIPVPPGGCRLLGLSPATANPSVIGSSLHLGMGTLEVAQLAWRDDHWQLRLRHPGRHEGHLYLQHPDHPDPLQVPVAFENQTEVDLTLPPPLPQGPV